MNTEEWVIDEGGNAKDPSPAVHLMCERLKRKKGEDTTAHLTKQNVVSIGIPVVECPTKHNADDGLWNPDSFHLFAERPNCVEVGQHPLTYNGSSFLFLHPMPDG